MKPLVSIVIPTYNRARDLERALKSVIDQTYSHWEALIIDNHSSDDTDDLIRGINDPRVKLFKIHNEGVIAASRNIGIKHALGKYIAFLDSDDWWMRQKLEVSVKYLEQGAEVVYHDLFLAKKPGQMLYWRKAHTRDLKSPVFNDLIINGYALNNSSVVASRQVMLKINGFSEEQALIAAEDYDGWLRAAKITEKFKKIPRTLGYYWLGGENTSNPARTLKTLDAIEEHYSNAILNLDLCHRIYWLNYTKGRAYYSLGHYKISRKYLKLVITRGAGLGFKVKSFYMIIAGSMQMVFCKHGVQPYE